MDLSSSDPERAKDFYSQTFGWRAEQLGEEFGNYVTFAKADAVIAGMMKNDPGSGVPDGWATYLASADANATAQAAKTAGGQVLMEPMQVMDLGAMAVLVDPGGAAIGVWQPEQHQGFGLVGEAGAPVWHELHTGDYAGTVSFYQRVFGWTTNVMSDTDDFRYTVMVDDDGTQLAGVMDAQNFMPQGAPASWAVYLGVEDVDASLDTVQRLGGTVLDQAQDTPFGRLATAADPTGAKFKLSSLQT